MELALAGFSGAFSAGVSDFSAPAVSSGGFAAPEIGKDGDNAAHGKFGEQSQTLERTVALPFCGRTEPGVGARVEHARQLFFLSEGQRQELQAQNAGLIVHHGCWDFVLSEPQREIERTACHRE